jgi:hypothetical protein
MKKNMFLIIWAVVFLLFSTTVVAQTKILSKSISYSDRSESIDGTVKLGERVEIKIAVLISESRSVTFFTRLQNPVFYLTEEKLTENSSLSVELTPGTHTVRCLGYVGNSKDGDEIILLGSDSMSEYILARIESPFILKDEALGNYAVIGVLSVIGTIFVTVLLAKGKRVRTKSVFLKKTENKRKKVRELLKTYFENVAVNLNNPQRQDAKTLVNEIEEVLKW